MRRRGSYTGRKRRRNWGGNVHWGKRRRYNYNRRTGGYLGREVKFYDTALVTGALASTGTNWAGAEQNPSATICLNSVTQGDGESQRDGRNISMKSVQINGLVGFASQTNQTATDVLPIVHLAVVLDTQTNGALLNSEDVYINPSANGTVGINPFRNLQYSKRFRILGTRKIAFTGHNSVYDGTNIEIDGYYKPFKIFCPLKGMKTTYSGTTETIANIVDNSISIIAATSSTDLAPSISYNARLRFCG